MALQFFVQTRLSWSELLGTLPKGVEMGRQSFADGTRPSRLVLYYATPPDPEESGSTTGAHLLQDDGRVEVRIPKFSSPVDTVLGLSTIEGVSQLVGAPLERADATVIDGGVDDRLVQQVAEAKSAAEARLLRRALDEDAVVGVHGYRRPVFIGRRVVERLASGALSRGEGVERAGELILGVIEAVQCVDDKHYRMPAPTPVAPTGRSPYTFVACARGRPLFVPASDYAALLGPGEPLFVRYGALAEIASDRFAWIDDRQALFDADMDEAAWGALLDRGRAHEIPLGER